MMCFFMRMWSGLEVANWRTQRKGEAVCVAETESVYVQFVGPGIPPEAQEVWVYRFFFLYIKLCDAISSAVLHMDHFYSYVDTGYLVVKHSQQTDRQRIVGVPTQNSFIRNRLEMSNISCVRFNSHFDTSGWTGLTSFQWQVFSWRLEAFSQYLHESEGE